MLSKISSLKLSDLPKKQCAILRAPSSTRPTIWLIEQSGIRAVVKDFSRNSFFYRNIIGRFLIWRESKAYRKLANLKGVPKCFGTIDGLALVLEEIPGKVLELLEFEIQLSEDFFISLRNLVKELHNRGLAHCDLKRASNTLIGIDGHPYIVDFSAAISKNEFGFFPLSLAFQRFKQDDLNAIVKLQLRHCPDHINEEDKKRYYYRNKLEKGIRKIRDKARNLLKQIA